MGKGKRNRQFHFEDKQANPEKYAPRKKPFRMPKWANYTIAAVLALAIIIPVVISSLIGSGVFLRSRILVDSKSGQFDVNQQMATFMLWQNMYQSAYYEYYYMQWGLTEDTNKVVDTYKNIGGAAAYGVDIASYYTNYLLHTGIQDMTEYLCELVAGADAGVALGLKLDKSDNADIESYTTWIENVCASLGYANSNKFLSTYVGEGVSAKDVKSVAKLITMYTKYCNHTKLEMDPTPTDDILNLFIEKNPSGHYEIKYHQFSGASENFMKKLYEKLGKEWTTPTIPAKDAEKAIAETLTGIDAETLRKLVIEIILEENQKELVLNQYVVSKDAGVHKSMLDTATATGKTEEDLNNTLGLLGITKAAYTKESEGVNDDVKTWILNTKRKAKEYTLITSDESVYLVYIFTAPTTANSTTTVEAGWREYKFADCLTQYPELNTFFGVDGLLFKDIDAGEKQDATKDTYKSAEQLAKDLFDQIKASSSVWDSVADKTVDVTITKPGDNDSNTSAMQDKLFGAGVTLAIGDVYQVDDGGTSYIVKVTAVAEDKKSCTVDYATIKDSDYHALYRSLSETFNSSYKTSQTLSHPETSEKGSMNEWLAEGKFNEETSKRDFNRKENDVAYFLVTDSDNKNITGYNVCIVEKPMTSTKENDSQKADSAYGGYLLFETEAEAVKAYNSLQGLAGFNLWNAFGKLSVDKVTTGSDGKETVNTTEATIDTSLVKADLTDENLQAWMLAPDRKADDLVVFQSKDGKGYYLAYHISHEQVWRRTAKDSWVTAQMTEKLEGLIKDGGYALNEEEFFKITITEQDQAEYESRLKENETTTAAVA